MAALLRANPIPDAHPMWAIWHRHLETDQSSGLLFDFYRLKIRHSDQEGPPWNRSQSEMVICQTSWPNSVLLV